jgi:immune inhibitor A
VVSSGRAEGSHTWEETEVSHQTARGSMRVRRVAALLGSLLMLASVLPMIAGTALAAPKAAGATAAGFLYFKFPGPQPLCNGVGLNVSSAPYFKSGQCGFSSFGITGADATADVSVDFVGPNGSTFQTEAATFDDVNGDWEFSITPATGWPAGWIEARVSVDGDLAGSTKFGFQLLGANLAVDPAGAPYRPGEALPITGNIAELDIAANAGGVIRTGVPATLSLAVITPAGEVRPVPGGPLTAAANGNFSATVPGSLTADLTAVGDELELSVAVVARDATYNDASTGAWAAAEAGRTAVTLLASPNRLSLSASFVSSVGWVKPGDSYPFRIFVTNPTDALATNVVVSIAAPPSSSFLDATPLNGAGTASRTATSITWTIGSIPAATAAGPMVRTLVVTGRAARLNQDPKVVWKDLSTRATLSYTGQPGPIASTTHGPKVIPPNGNFETARYGDKPFPIVPVEYVDLERQSNSTWDNDADKLSRVVNDPGFVGSTFNLYQEMSYGQLFPQGSVPSAGIATARFSDYLPGFNFTKTDHTNPKNAACRGTTAAEAPGLIGSAAFDNRIEDGWYQLPGTTEYYGGDFPVFTSLTIAIDSACGPLGKSVYDAAQISDPEIDYNAFDSDKDGVVDFFMLVFVGCGGNGPSQIQANCEYFGSTPPYDNIWPHSSSLEAQFRDPATGLRGYISDDQLKSLHEVPQCWTTAQRVQFTDCAANGGTGKDNLPVFVRVGPYNVNPETVFQSASVISHEYGHHLGLPDFYSAGEEFYGDLNLMAADYSQHMTIFSKQELGWVVPDFLQPGQSKTVSGWNEIKRDTGAIHWETPGGTPYTLSAANGDQNIHNGQAYGLKLPGRQVLDPALVPSGDHVWWSGRGNDFGCSPTGGHNLDLFLPELASVPAGATVTLEFKSSWDIEWDWDYGFVLTSVDGSDYVSQPSANGYTTDNAYNPNDISCQAQLNNGITGTSGAWQAGEPTVTAARVPNFSDYSNGAPFIPDSYDISELAGAANPVLRFSYWTDGAFDRPGWFIDDVVVKVNGATVYSSTFEADDEAGRLFPGGCAADGSKVAATCTEGWSRIRAGEPSALDHAYYLELRDQSGFDFDGHNQSERGDTSWQPGVFLEYTNESHGYGNNGTPHPPAQHYLDSQPVPGSDCVSEQNGNCADVSFTDAANDSHFSDGITPAQPGGRIDSFDDPDSPYGDSRWHFDYGCLTLDVTSMAGGDNGPETPVTGNLVANATISAGTGCAPFIYGRGGQVANQKPVAVAQARPTEAEAGDPITFDGSSSTDDRQAPSELTYAWDFGDGESASGQTLQHIYGASGEYTATLTVTDDGGLTDTATVDVVITASSSPDLVVTDVTTVQNTGAGGKNGKPKEGDKVTIRATIQNVGGTAAPASSTVFKLDQTALPGSPVATGTIAAGGSIQVDLLWDTRGVSGEHLIGVTADAGTAVAESNESNNAGTLHVTVRGNKVENGSFEQSNAAGTGPEAWSGSSTPSGTTGYSSTGGSEGSRAVTITGTRMSTVTGGIATWTSNPIPVAPGEVLDLRVLVSSQGMSSAPGVGLAYLGPAGEVLNTVRLLDVPLVTSGFATLEESVTLPPGVAQVKVVLLGFTPGDLRTTGTVTFDEVGLYGP